MKTGSRYWIRGLMDGLISTLGVVIGAFNPDVRIIIAAGAAGAVANGVSNVMAAFMAEYTSHYQELRQLEQATLSDLSGTVHETRIQQRMYRDAALDGMASISGGLIPLIPFFVWQGTNALWVSIAVSALIMGVLGLWIGVLTRRNLIISFIKLIVMTLLTAGVCYVLGNWVQSGALSL